MTTMAQMATLTEMKITKPVLLVPIQSMTCRMDVSIENMKIFELFDLIEYKYIKNVIHNDKKMITIWIETKQVTERQKNTSFTFTLAYDKLNAKSLKVDRPYANGSWYEENVIGLVSIGKAKAKEEEDDSSDEDEDSSDEE